MLCPSLMPAASCGGVGRKSPVLLLLSKKRKPPRCDFRGGSFME